MNSTLFYWWWNLLSDCRHLNKRDINNFPFDIEQLNEDELMRFKKLFKRLMENFKVNKKEISMNLGAKKGRVTLESIDHQKSKQIIDEIDTVLGEYYDFDINELEYVKNYDLRFRMGVDENE